MQTGFPAAAIVAALALLCACRGDAAVNEGAQAAAPATPPALHVAPSHVWQRTSRINILCQLSSAAGNDPAMTRQLCDRIRGIAAATTTLPVAVADAPDAATLGGDAVVLLVHASVQAAEGRNWLIYTIRPFRRSAGDDAALFGTAPRAVALDGAGIAGAQTGAALAASLGEILPWLSGGNDPRPL